MKILLKKKKNDQFQFVEIKTEYDNGLQIAYQVHAVSEMALLF